MHLLYYMYACCLLTGLRSQWIIFSLYRIFKHCSNEYPNLLINEILNPWKLFFLMSSYKFILYESQQLQMNHNKKSTHTQHSWKASVVTHITQYMTMCWCTRSTHLYCLVHPHRRYHCIYTVYIHVCNVYIYINIQYVYAVHVFYALSYPINSNVMHKWFLK